jgi:antagonist of KipI
MAVVKRLKVLAPGVLTSVQDLGRYGYGRYGVAPSGALDSFSLRIANLLVGNREDQACLEAMLTGPKIRFLTEAVVAITGGDLRPHCNQQPVEMWQSHVFKANDVLSFKAVVSGFRAYIAVNGGIGVPAVMGSRSTNLTSGFGGCGGRALQAGDILYSKSSGVDSAAVERRLNPECRPSYDRNWSLRVVWGPQDEQFPDQSRDLFVTAAYRMSPQSDRTGIRLDGPVIDRKPEIQESIISEGVISGSIQIPGDGKPIIILGETVTGGYRKIATVISADLPLLGQIKPGDEIRFEAISQKAALCALRGMEDKIREFRALLNS